METNTTSKEPAGDHLRPYPARVALIDLDTGEHATAEVFLATVRSHAEKFQAVGDRAEAALQQLGEEKQEKREQTIAADRTLRLQRVAYDSLVLRVEERGLHRSAGFADGEAYLESLDTPGPVGRSKSK